MANVVKPSGGQDSGDGKIMGMPKATFLMVAVAAVVVVVAVGAWVMLSPPPSGRGNYQDTANLMPAANSPKGGLGAGSAVQGGMPNGGMPVVSPGGGASQTPPNGGMPVVQPNGGMPVVR